MKTRLSIILLAVLLIPGIISCSGQSQIINTTTVSKGPINVSAKADTEGSLLGNVIMLMLKANSFQVNDKTGITGTPLIRQAIISGEIDIYPEYTGNGAFFFSETDSPVWKDAQQGYERVKQLDLQNNNIVWLAPAPANNTWAIAIPRSLAEKENIHSLVDFAGYINRGGFVKLIASEEFVTSEVALPAFEAAYGFSLQPDQIVTISGGNTGQTEKAASEGTDGVNAAMAYGTDGGLSALNLLVLTDPKGVQPVYEPAPIVRWVIYNKYPEMATILDPVFQSYSLETLQNLNSQIAFTGQDAGKVAQDYLVSKGFLKP